MSEGRALARRVAGSEATKGITDGLLEAQGFLVSFVGSRTGQMTTIALAGTPAGRELAATITEMPSARQIAALLGRSSEGLDEVVALARSPVGRGLAESLCQIESSLTYAADVAQAEPGHLIAQYLADSSRALPLICSAAARDEETLAVFRQIAATRTCHDLATALAATASGRDLAEAMYLSDPAREIIRTVELTSQSSFDGNTDTAGLASSCIMMQIAVQFSVITAGLVFYVAVNAATD
ncbi:MAG: hypothetical protein GY724_03110 [Actinomycetia bacterium]|nr:hypothetical protein [Actinomycetes bacterium]MCP5030860.1 hypothetical protein [Actinomycetes bacterium]